MSVLTTFFLCIVFVVVYFENRKETLTHVYLVLSSTQAINKFRIF